MITLQTKRDQVATFINECFDYIDLWKQTNLRNVPTDKINDAYLVATVVNCTIGEVQDLLQSKYARTKAEKLKFELSDGQAVVLYKILLYLPIPSQNVYLQLFRANWIEQLDKAVIRQQILLKPVPLDRVPVTDSDFTFD